MPEGGEMMREMICICCPMGCRLTVDDSDVNNVKVSGNTCPRGEKYGKEEVVCPKRMVTSVVRVKGGDVAMVSVKTKEAIEKSRIFDALDALKGVEVKAPVKIGDVIVKDVLGSGVDFIATKNVAAR